MLNNIKYYHISDMTMLEFFNSCNTLSKEIEKVLEKEYLEKVVRLAKEIYVYAKTKAKFNLNYSFRELIDELEREKELSAEKVIELAQDQIQWHERNSNRDIVDIMFYHINNEIYCRLSGNNESIHELMMSFPKCSLYYSFKEKPKNISQKEWEERKSCVNQMRREEQDMISFTLYSLNSLPTNYILSSIKCNDEDMYIESAAKEALCDKYQESKELLKEKEIAYLKDRYREVIDFNKFFNM